MLSSSLVLLLVIVSGQTVLGQYDDLSVLDEVLTRRSMRPIIRQIPVQPTTPIIELLKETETTVEITSSVPTTEELSTVTITTTTQEPTEATTESTTQSTEASSTTTTTTELPMTTTFSQIEESTDSVDELFMGMKRPDLATIYRRLFPFRH